MFFAKALAVSRLEYGTASFRKAASSGTLCLLMLAVVWCGGCGSGGSAASGTTPPMGLLPAHSSLNAVQEFGTNTYDALTKQGDTMTGMIQDGSGNIYVTGYTAGDLPGYSGTPGILKGIVYKLDATGKQVWSKELTSSNGARPAAVLLTSNGVTVVGDTLGAFAGASNPQGLDELVIAQYDTTGNLITLKQYPPQGLSFVNAACGDAAGNVFVGGESGDSAGGQDVFVEKIDTSGNVAWLKTYGIGAVDGLQSVSCDANGNVYAAGWTDGAFPGGPGNANLVPFVLKLNGTTGATLWQQSFTGQSALTEMIVSAVLSGPNDTLYASGSVPTYGVDERVEALQLDPATGTPIWTLALGAGGINLGGQSMALDASGNLYVAGYTQGALVSGATSGTQDVFLAKVSPTGAALWAQQFGTGTDQPGLPNTGYAGIFVSSGAQDVVVGGVTSGQFQGFSNPNHDIELYIALFGQ